jgi:fructose-1,6-bisphosphatase/sedoheptulose 1,7-bisphosphatase-like protein
MQYAREVMDLMGAYPGREFRMAGIVRYIVGKTADARRKKACTEAVRRVLQALKDSGAIEIKEAECNGAPATYTWKSSECGVWKRHCVN